MKITAIQLNSKADKIVNFNQVQAFITQAVAVDKPDLLALPEMFNFVGGTLAQKRAAAEILTDEAITYKFLQDLAKQYSVAIHAGSIREQWDDQYYNTTLAFDANGKELARYRKIHLFDVATPDGMQYSESALLSPGEEIVSYTLNNIKIGCAICYDLRFAELFLQLADMDCNVIIIPAAFTYQTGQAHWEILLRARAIETQCYVVAPAQTGTYIDNNIQKNQWGHTVIIDPWGNIIKQLQDEVGFVTANIDLAFLENVRQRMPIRNHRRLRSN